MREELLGCTTAALLGGRVGALLGGRGATGRCDGCASMFGWRVVVLLGGTGLRSLVREVDDG